MTSEEMIKTLNKIMLINYTSCYKVLTEDGTYAVPFEQEVNALIHAISLLEAEGEGRLVELSCKIGDTVYVIADCANVLRDCDDDYITGTGAIYCPFESECEFDECDDAHKRIFETVVRGIWLDDDGLINYFFENIIDRQFYQSDFGKTVFLTREEAAANLEGTEQKNDQ